MRAGKQLHVDVVHSLPKVSKYGSAAARSYHAAKLDDGLSVTSGGVVGQEQDQQTKNGDFGPLSCTQD